MCFARRSCGASGMQDAKSSSNPIPIRSFKPAIWPGVTQFTQVWLDSGTSKPLTCFAMKVVDLVCGKTLRKLGAEVRFSTMVAFLLHCGDLLQLSLLVFRRVRRLKTPVGCLPLVFISRNLTPLSNFFFKKENASRKEYEGIFLQGNYSQVAPACSRYARSWCGKLGVLKALAFLCMITTRRVLLKSEQLCKLSSMSGRSGWT
jgi:hypothetical protein